MEVLTKCYSDEDDIVASWEWAKQQCEKNLNPYDFAKLQDFPTPEKLADDLRTKEPQRPNFHYIRPAIKSMRSFLQFFVVTMSPRNIEGSIFWGIFYLLVQVGTYKPAGMSAADRLASS